MSPDYLQRFSGIGRLYGANALPRFHQAHVCIVGVGGVGSWIVEALARSGIGALTLIDLDDVCITIINRQLPALGSTVGQPKTEILARRIAEINPECTVTQVLQFVSEANAPTLLQGPFSLIIDAVDRMSIKSAIIASATQHQIPVITCGSAGGRIDPSKIVTKDLGLAGHDPLLQQVRRKLRKDHGFSKSTDGRALELGIPCVYSTESPRFPLPDGNCSLEKPADLENGIRLDCAAGFGAATHLTGTFAFAAAAEALKLLAKGGV
jgi:tRNA A37 threonylcarbamoyladenosine dehydratase